jgi:hypothetical protein
MKARSFGSPAALGPLASEISVTKGAKDPWLRIPGCARVSSFRSKPDRTPWERWPHHPKGWGQPRSTADPTFPKGLVQRRKRTGGLLSYYYREAAFEFGPFFAPYGAHETVSPRIWRLGVRLSWR